MRYQTDPWTDNEESSAPTGTGLKLGIVHLGRAGGKPKYMLLEAADIPFVKQFCFEVRIEVDPNGEGAAVFAFARRPDTLEEGKPSSTADIPDAASHVDSQGLFHVLLWQYRIGPIPTGYKVMHCNGITVDNRLTNLQLVDEKEYPSPTASLVDRGTIRPEGTLYAAALRQLPLGMENDPQNNTQTFDLDPNGDVVEAVAAQPYRVNECQYGLCFNMELLSGEYVSCDRCGRTRYCSARCQHMDWRNHKKECGLLDGSEEAGSSQDAKPTFR
eukprot:Clim_evm63s150 gene=Clim_evmTU63s150